MHGARKPNREQHAPRSSPAVFSLHNLQRDEREKATCVNCTSGFLLRAKGGSRIKENPTLDYASDLFALAPPAVARKGELW